jgi:hypothetical protein
MDPALPDGLVGRAGSPGGRNHWRPVFFADATPGMHDVKWAGMFLFGFIILMGGVVAALWKLGVLARVGTTWTIIGLVIALGLGIMISVGSSGAKENIQIDRK